MNTLRYVRMVLWSFFGVRRRAGADDELARARPIPLLVMAFAIAGGFAALLIGLANLAVGRLI